MRIFVFCIITFLFAVSDPAAIAARRSLVTGVIGKDNRRIVDIRGTPWSAIGHVNVSGYRRRTSCTGTLIAPDLVLTAAHCLMDKFKRKPHPVRSMHFVAGVNRGENLGHSRVRCIHMQNYVTAVQNDVRDIERLKLDLAILVLEDPLKIPPLMLINKTEITAETPLVHPSYPRDRRFLLTAHFNCRLLRRLSGLLVTTCDTNQGSSGGPVLVKLDDSYHIVGVMVAVQQGAYSIAVPVSQDNELSGLKCPPVTTEPIRRR